MKKYLYILLAFGILCLAACEKLAEDSTVANVNDGYADLTISFNAPTSQLSVTRSLQSDPLNEGKTWTNWEKFVDGALLYRVTIFVINTADNTLAAYRDFYSGSDDNNPDAQQKGDNGFYENPAVNTSATTGVAVKATFNASSPLHEDEQLQAGNYKVIAVANYAPIATTDAIFAEDETAQAYDGLGLAAEDGTDVKNGDAGDFTTLVNNIISEGINYDFDETEKGYGQALLNYTLNSGDDRVCKLMPQPLVMIRSVELENGDNQLTGTLSRTFARVRIAVKNNDKTQYLGVYGFTFADSYASGRTYLFNDVTAGTNNTNNMYENFALYEDTKAAIDVSSTDAIESFTAVNQGDTRRMPPDTEYLLFDCYILEGKIANQFAFQFTASYWSAGSGGDATPELHVTKFYQSEYPENYEAGGRDPYGLLEYNVFLRCETSTKTNAQTASSSVVLLKSPEASYTSDATLLAEIPKDANGEEITKIELGTTHIDPEYIWQIKLNKTEAQVADGDASITYSNGVGFETGALQNLGSNLYLQAYDGGNDMTPKLSEDIDKSLIFKINLKDMYEVGTIFCYVNNKYYYLKYDATNGIKWVEFNGTVTASSGEYRYFTWDTIGGTGGTRTDVTVGKTIGNTSVETATNEIVRNDFYNATIPISYSQDSANSSTTTDSTTTTE